MWFCYRQTHDFRKNRERGYRIVCLVRRPQHLGPGDEQLGIDLSEADWDSQMLCYPHVFGLRGQGLSALAAMSLASTASAWPCSSAISQVRVEHQHHREVAARCRRRIFISGAISRSNGDAVESLPSGAAASTQGGLLEVLRAAGARYSAPLMSVDPG